MAVHKTTSRFPLIIVFFPLISSAIVPENNCTLSQLAEDIYVEPPGENFTYNESVSLRCQNESWTLIGSNQLTCQDGGIWNAPIPECKYVRCTLPHLPPDVEVYFSDAVRENQTESVAAGSVAFLPGSQVTYSCPGEAGTSPGRRQGNGSVVLECGVDGGWLLQGGDQAHGTSVACDNPVTTTVLAGGRTSSPTATGTTVTSGDTSTPHSTTTARNGGGGSSNSSSSSAVSPRHDEATGAVQPRAGGGEPAGAPLRPASITLGVVIAGLAVLAAAFLAAYCRKRGSGGRRQEQTAATSFENPVYDYDTTGVALT